MEIKGILESLGYKLYDNGKYWRARAIYRDSHNNTSLRVSKKTGNFIDFSAGKRGNLEELIRLSLNLNNIEEAKSWLGSRSFVRLETERLPLIESVPKWNLSILDNFIPDHSYWKNREISEETIKLFKGGLFKEWKMDNRYVFPIFDNNQSKIIGFSGRDLGNGIIKWKNIGRKNKWIWPAFLNKNIIKEKKEVILVESPGCVLKLWEAGFKNSLCLFGVELFDSMICFLVGIQPNKILISLNNEPENNNVGNNASKKIEKRLSHFFNSDKIKIALPVLKDFAEMDLKNIKLWYNELE